MGPFSFRGGEIGGLKEAFALIEQNFLKGQGKILDFCARLSRSAMVYLFPEFLDIKPQV
jgi:hypothetical protein